MAKPLQQDVLSAFVKRGVRNALELEYAIRASELISPDQMQGLRALDAGITRFWTGLGATPEEIDDSRLRDFAWDTLQIGFLMTRRHTTGVDPEIVEIANEGLSRVRAEFASDLHLLTLPAARYFRVCDLLAGNNIPRLIGQVNDCLAEAAKYKRDSDVPLSEFRIQVREPIHLHPHFACREACKSGGGTVFSFEIDLAGEFSLFEWKRQLNEFKYQYALFRASHCGAHDGTTRALIQDFLEQEQEGSQSEFDVPRLDSFLPLLTGIYCWDRYKRDGLTQVDSFEEAKAFYPSAGLNPITHDNLRSNYRKASERIRAMAGRFLQTGKSEQGSERLREVSPALEMNLEELERFGEWEAGADELLKQARKASPHDPSTS